MAVCSYGLELTKNVHMDLLRVFSDISNAVVAAAAIYGCDLGE